MKQRTKPKRWALGRGRAFGKNDTYPYLRRCIICRCWFEILPSFGRCSNCLRSIK